MIVIAREGDEYQAIQVKEQLAELSEIGTPRVVYPKSKDDLSFLQYRTFEDNRLVIIHASHAGHLSEVFKADFDFWDIILYVEKLGSVTPFLSKEIQERVIQLEVVKTYEERKQFFSTRLKGYLFERGIKNTLLRLLVRTPTEYESVKTYLSNWDKSVPISLEDVQYMVGDSDIYSLDECLLNIIYGKGKQKTVWMLDYFITKREYHPIWIYKQLVGMVLDIGYMYQLYKEGVVQYPISESDYLKRVQTTKIKPKDKWLSYRTQQTILDNIKKESVTKYAKRSRIIFNTKVSSADGLYELMVRLQNYEA